MPEPWSNVSISIVITLFDHCMHSFIVCLTSIAHTQIYLHAPFGIAWLYVCTM